jgi:PAS domain-containing protein
MSEKRLEVILTRLLAGYLATPVVVVDAAGTLLFFNEPAEILLGQRFDETGELPAATWSTFFSLTDSNDAPIPIEALPLTTALAQRRPAHGAFWIHTLDGKRRHVEVTALPLIGLARAELGALATLWVTEP